MKRLLAPTKGRGRVPIGALTVGVDKVETQLLTSEALVADSFDFGGGQLFLESRIRMPDGQVLTWEQMSIEHPEIINNGYDPDTYRDVVLYIPGSRYPEIEAREALALGAVAAAVLIAGAVTVVRRRPR
jgi:hypothetical protein